VPGRHLRATQIYEQRARSRDWAATFWDRLHDHKRAAEARRKAELLRHAAEREAGWAKPNRKRF
jgi:hypothetical protein